MSKDFKYKVGQEIEYDYDANGNQVKDLNKGISKIEYNVLNLPKKVTFTGVNNPTTTYAYSAGGDKLNVIHKSSIETRTDYVGNKIYQNDSLKRILVEGGYYESAVNSYCFYQVNLMKTTVAQGREDFLNHPVTQGGINFTLFLATGGIEGIEGIAGIVRSMAKSAAKASSRAFFSGAGTEVRALNEGFTTLSQTRAGKNLMKMTEGMPYYPGSQAYNWWARLSSTYAKGVPKGSNVNVFPNNPSPTGIWNAVEKPILQQRRINIIYR